MTLSLVPELAGFHAEFGGVMHGAGSAYLTQRISFQRFGFQKAGKHSKGRISFRHDSK
jgi:hypothetical protein